jgi:hypothetical protein
VTNSGAISHAFGILYGITSVAILQSFRTLFRTTSANAVFRYLVQNYFACHRSMADSDDGNRDGTEST